VLLLVPASITLVMAYQRRWLDDDGFINLRIARNLLDGHGPVFNIDERVEAGTSPLWLAVVSLLGALGARLEDASVYTGIALTGLAVLVAQHAAMRLYAPAGSSLWARLSLSGRAGEGALRFDTWLPLGALTIAVLPPIWDYASSGLETGLSLCWLALAYDVLVTRLMRALWLSALPESGVDLAPSPSPRPSSLRRQLGAASWLGVGSLIRPELTLYALAFFALYLGILWHSSRGAPERASKDPSDRRGLLVRAACLVAAFAGLPVSYQVFRMGYYGALSPNTAIAKEAFLVSWDQGRCYLANYLDTYKLWLPLLALALLFVWRLYASLARPRAPRVSSPGTDVDAAAAPIFAGSPDGGLTPPSSFARLLWLGVLLAPPTLGLLHAL
jgi:arabinofuranosyltransferase